LHISYFSIIKTINKIPTEIQVITADNATHFNAAKKLFITYQQWLGEDLCFQSFEEELLSISSMYAPPFGALLLAMHNDTCIGCVALRSKYEGVCEMKRLYVIEKYKQQGIGRLLVQKIIEKAIESGYHKMILDTLDRLVPALQLYKSLGFTETTAYYANPLKGVVYMEKKIR